MKYSIVFYLVIVDYRVHEYRLHLTQHLDDEDV